MGDIMKKFFLVGLVFMLCGCGSTVNSTIDDIKDADNTISNTVDTIQESNYAMAKNSMLGYVRSVELAYTEYQYGQLTGTYDPGENSILVYVEGNPVYLGIDSYGDAVQCNSISIVDGRSKLEGCLINGYTFSFIDGIVVDE